ncbi:ribosome biogenesis GTPase YqeH [Paenibacillus herberti]|uniref:Ribosome biogenesis GTPase YqeH n=1 Tax=Paenibacillus herberti TaxID=1619309 RepID=A0A229P5Q5_9BACL|nr:ribosome biogenesis GTPase YqeH [Paenibacillus herberti]OXM17430.1 ribosome biogenesis GTPase YqeH [Paenibacillus herberti]
MKEQGKDKDQPSCAGCGASLQTQSKDRPGYVPASALDAEAAICQRCFRIRNYNDAVQVSMNNDEFLKLLGGIASTDSLVVHIVDLFDFEGSLISGLQRFVGNNPVLLVVNKIDLLPKGTNYNRLRNWVQRQAKAQGLRTVDVVLCSAKRGMGFDRVVEAVEQLRGQRDVYVVGATNVGKSTLINRLIADYSDLERELTVSRFPGTTLDEIRIPLDDGKSIIDTPGIVYTSRLTELVPRGVLGSLLPDKPIKSLVYQLDAGQTLFFGSLVRFDYTHGANLSFTLYTANAMKVHRTKLERADELYAQHKGVMLAPPSLEELQGIPAWTRHSLRIPRGSESDIFISGLGWIRVNGTNGAQVEVYAPKGVKVLVREALI